MFFYLCHDRLPAPVLVVLSADGLPFLRAEDLARILEYRNTYRFSSMYASLRIRDIVYKKMELPRQVLDTKIFSAEEAIELLRPCRRRSAYNLRFALEASETCRVLPLETIRATTKQKRAMRVKFLVGEYSNSMTFRDFLNEFKTKTFLLYEDLAREYMFKRIEIHSYNSSLEILRLPEPPRKVLVHFGDEVFEYRLN